MCRTMKAEALMAKVGCRRADFEERETVFSVSRHRIEVAAEDPFGHGGESSCRRLEMSVASAGLTPSA